LGHANQPSVPTYLPRRLRSGGRRTRRRRLRPRCRYRRFRLRHIRSGDHPRRHRHDRNDGSRRHVLLQDRDDQILFARSYDHRKRRAHQALYERFDGSKVAERAVGRLKRLYEGAVVRAGRVFNIVRAMSLSPSIMNASLALYRRIMFAEEGLSRVQRELLAVVVSSSNDCHY